MKRNAFLSGSARTLLLGGLSVLGLIVLNGCAFQREWKTALKQGYGPNELSGPWTGKWSSTASGHEGKLQCVITKKSESEYDAHYHANYKKILSFSYTVPMKVTRTGTSYKFSGEADLGKMAGGAYTYVGAANGTNFISTYDCESDHGKFEMTRPK
jgi:hypothetical protein